MKKAAAFIFLALLAGSTQAAEKKTVEWTPKSGKPAAAEPIGRWQIVQGPPAAVYRTFLIDTVTGDSYIICFVGEGEDRSQAWCVLPRTTIPAGKPGA